VKFSVIKIAALNRKKRSSKLPRINKVTIKEPVIIGYAPINAFPIFLKAPRIPNLPVRKSPNETPSLVKVEIPLLATKYKIDRTTKTINAITQKTNYFPYRLKVLAFTRMLC